MVGYTNKTYNQYINILKEELISSAGCTEPIAIAYACAKARTYLPSLPVKVNARISINLLKNTKSVVIPNTNGNTGVKTAISAGIVAGNADKKLEVLTDINEEVIPAILKFKDKDIFHITALTDGAIFDFIIELVDENNNTVELRLQDNHTNIVYIKKNNEFLYQKQSQNNDQPDSEDRNILNINDIYDFSKKIDIKTLEEIFTEQIHNNMEIANEGLSKSYGIAIGKSILEKSSYDSRSYAKAMAAAGADARMAGCNIPVVITAGSGNQGITTSVPVIAYGEKTNKSYEEVLRALSFSVLTTIHQKTGIGKLSAYCGAVNAATSSAAAIAFLEDENLDIIKNTMTNSLAILSGMICDGAKASCSAKIVSSLDTAFIAYDMAKNGKVFKDGDGIIGNDIEKTIENVGKLAKNGMKETDIEIVNIMLS